jgi:crossover junction endodeoxyribonuclease RusA
MTPYPISVNRYYRTFRNITTISKEGRLFKQHVQLNHRHIKPVNNDVALDITIHPKQKKNGETYNKIIDLDNGLKCILDSLIGIVYFDDKQVKKIHIEYGDAVSGGGASVIIDDF